MRDDRGLSLRGRCFQLFDDGERPVEVAKELRMKESTAKSYFQQWKRLGPNFDRRHIYLKGLFKKTNPNRDRNLDLYARAWGIEKEELETLLAQSHGLRRLMTGKFYLPEHANADYKFHVAMEVALFISDHLIKSGGKIEDVRFALERLMKERMEFREEEEVDTKEENWGIAFTRQVLEAADKTEQEGRVKRDRLTDAEVNSIIKYGLEAKRESDMRFVEKLYWICVAGEMDHDLTKEQAREKIYQDLLGEDNTEGAKAMRSFQDIIHPLKDDDQVPPPSPC